MKHHIYEMFILSKIGKEEIVFKSEQLQAARLYTNCMMGETHTP